MYCLNYAYSLFNNAHIVKSTREQPNLKQSRGYLPEINNWFHLKQTKYLCKQLEI